jgi:tetratricopeptide (TPR) repeat protein
VTLDEEIELRYPSATRLTVISPNDKPDVRTEGSDTVERWHRSQLKPTVAPPGGTAPASDDTQPKLVPDVAWTTFPSWAAVGEWYRGLIADRAVPDATLQTKAAALIAGATTDDEKISRIYSFVSMQIRYIGIDFGIGRYQPHAALEVLNNGYGDCKDKHTLLAALLTAAGFHVDPVLIGANIHLDQDLPAPNSFNHLITVVERPNGQRLWLDSTAEVAPPGMLFSTLRNEDALLIPPAGSGVPLLVKTPAAPPFAAFDHYEASGTLAPDGKLTAHFTVTLRGDLELLMRSSLFASGAGQWTQVGQSLSGAMGFGGTVSAFHAAGVDKPDEPLDLTYDYERDQYGDWPNHRILSLLPSPLFLQMEPTKQPDQPFDLGAPRIETAKSTIVVPPGFSAAQVPNDYHARSSFGTYDITYTFHGSTLLTEARLQIRSSSLPAAQWQELASFAKDIEANNGNFTTLAENAPAASTPQSQTLASTPATILPAPTVVTDAAAQALLIEAQASFRAGNLTDAHAKLDAARAINPRQPGVSMTLAAIEARQGHYQDAEAEILQEPADTPEARYAVLATLLSLQLRLKQNTDAITTLESMRTLHPEKTELLRREAAMLSTEKRYEESISLLEGAALHNPSDKRTLLALGTAQFAAGRPREAQTTLETALDTTQDPEILNDAAYELANHNLDLPAAQKDAQAALALVARQTGSATLSALTSQDLAGQRLLGSVWDTLGWIEYLQGNTAAAEDYLRAAWINAERSEIGYHLGALYEKEGKAQEAFDTYALAETTPGFDLDATESPYVEDLHKRKAALAAKGLKTVSTPEPATRLADLRSINLPLVAQKYTEADFLVEASATGIDKVQFLEGSPLLKDQANALRTALAKDHSMLLFPKGSEAHLIRRGILSCQPVMKACQFTLFLPQDTRLPKPSDLTAPAAPIQ